MTRRLSYLLTLLLPWANVPYAASAQPPATTENSQAALLEEQAFQAAVERVMPAVVRVELIGGTVGAAASLERSAVTSGLIVSPDGLVITSDWALAGDPASLLVVTADGQRHAAVRVAGDRARQLTLLRVSDVRDWPVVEPAPSATIQVGQWALAVGRTLEPVRPNVSVGIVSALRRTWGTSLQTDAKISPHNYGGPLIDIAGRVLGVIVPLGPEAAEGASPTELYDSGIGFAIPLEDILAVLPRLATGEELRPGRAGFELAGSDLVGAQARVELVRPNSPAARAGIQTGDLITRVAGQAVDRQAVVREVLTPRYAGDRVAFELRRGDESHAVELELAAEIQPYAASFLGVLVADSPRTPRRLAVRWVFPGSSAEAAGLTADDLLLAINGQAVTDRESLQRILSTLTPNSEIALDIERRSQPLKFSLALGEQLSSLPDSPPLPHPDLPENAAPRGQVKPYQDPTVPNSESLLYVPAALDPAAAAPLIVWLHSGTGCDPGRLRAVWGEWCERQQAICLVPRAIAGHRWSATDVDLVRRLLQWVGNEFRVDPARVVVGGDGSGGRMALACARQLREQVRGAVLLDTPPTVQPAPSEPAWPLDLLLLTQPQAAWTPLVRRTAAVWQAERYPVIVLDRPPGDPFQSADLQILARWLAVLDRY